LIIHGAPTFEILDHPVEVLGGEPVIRTPQAGPDRSLGEADPFAYRGVVECREHIHGRLLLHARDHEGSRVFLPWRVTLATTSDTRWMAKIQYATSRRAALDAG
jgi:hypothetical protein